MIKIIPLLISQGTTIKKLDELKKLQAEGLWPPADEEKAEELLGRKNSKKKTSKKKQ